jgi:hypothetical protein
MARRPATPDVVGFPQIAERTGRSKVTVRGWKNDYEDWPEPRGYLSEAQGGPGSAPWWLWWDIERFLDRHPAMKEVRQSNGSGTEDGVTAD